MVEISSIVAALGSHLELSEDTPRVPTRESMIKTSC
jgi:hypothetical protein